MHDLKEILTSTLKQKFVGVDLLFFLDYKKDNSARKIALLEKFAAASVSFESKFYDKHKMHMCCKQIVAYRESETTAKFVPVIFM